MLGAARAHAGKGRLTESDFGPTRALLQIVYGHLDDPETSGLERGVTYLKLRPGARRRGKPAA